MFLYTFICYCMLSYGELSRGPDITICYNMLVDEGDIYGYVLYTGRSSRNA